MSLASDARPQVYWIDEPLDAREAATASLPKTADVVVLGGGLTGLSAAYWLAQAGRSVLVLEQDRLMNGASGRNGGQVLTGLNPGFRDLVRRYGDTQARSLWQQSLDALDLLERLVDEEAIACDWHRGGHIAVAPDVAGFRELIRDQEALAAAGFPGDILDHQAVRERIGGGTWPGGTYDPQSATANPYRLGLGIARAARRYGAQFQEHTPGRVIREARGFTVTTPRGTVRTSTVFVATNAWLGDVIPALAPRIERVTGSMLATDPLPAALRDRLLPGRPAVFEESPRVVHFQKTRDHRLVFGGRTGAAADADGLLDLLRTVMPELTGVRPAYRWRGPLAIVRDGIPRIGRTAEGVYWAGGYSGHGVALAFWLGRLAALWIAADRVPDWPTDLPRSWPHIRFASYRRFRLHPGPASASQVSATEPG